MYGDITCGSDVPVGMLESTAGVEMSVVEDMVLLYYFEQQSRNRPHIRL